jgi:general secretion pathway protein N
MRAKAMAALGIAAYLVFLLFTTPASFIAARARAAAPGRIEMSEAKGSLWSGSARARIGAPGGHLIFERIEWQLAPARLMAGRIAFDLKAAGHGLFGHGQLARGLTRWELRDLEATGVAESLVPLVPLAATWRPEGTLGISSPALDWDDNDARGNLRAEWKDAAVSVSEVRPLGTYRLDAHAEGGPATLTLATVEGALRITGQGTFTPPSKLTLSGEAHGEGAQARALDPLLDLMGPRRPDGARALEIRVN